MKRLYEIGFLFEKGIQKLERKVFGRMDSNKQFEELRKEYLAQKMSVEQIEKMQKEMEAAKRKRRRGKQIVFFRKFAGAAAVLAVTFVTLPNTSLGVARAMENIPLLGKLVNVVTFREYRYEDDKNSALIEVPELVAQADGDGEAPLVAAYGAAAENETDGQRENSGNSGNSAANTDELALEADETSDGQNVQVNLEKSTEEINEEIRQITDNLMAEFEENLKNGEGYQNVLVKSEVLCTTEKYFTLKLICYQGMGSGAEWDYYYTIDLDTGNRLTLKELFPEGEDYLTAVSENIKKQMQEQMEADENVIYWLDTEEIPEWNFQSITEETSFYLNGDNQLVICFNEGDVAPMYMGCVSFVISEEIYPGK